MLSSGSVRVRRLHYQNSADTIIPVNYFDERSQKIDLDAAMRDDPNITVQGTVFDHPAVSGWESVRRVDLNYKLQAYWDFSDSSEPYIDLVSGTFAYTSGTPLPRVAGMRGYGLQMHPSARPLVLPPSINTYVGEGGYALSFWFLITGVHPVVSPLILYTTTTPPYYLYTWVAVYPPLAGSGSAYRLNVNSWSANTESISVASGVLFNKWHHLVISNNKLENRLYAMFDGEHRLFSSYTGIVSPTNQPIYGTQFGGIQTPGVTDLWLAGAVDEISYWSRELLQSEASYVYNGGSGRFYPSWGTV
jgi:hypothetical protein